jgi:hypothetical protein
MDIVKQYQKNRLNKLKYKNKEKLHGWLLINNIQHNNNKIYSSYDNNSYVEVSCVTFDKINPYPDNCNVEYKGIVNEFLGNMPVRNNIIENLLNKYHDTDVNKYII